MPLLSIIIPTLNRGRLLHKTILQVLAQSFTDFELIVVDQSDEPLLSQNRAFTASLADPRVSHLHIGFKNLPNARNEGLERVSGSIILFLDDDVILLSDDFLQAHMAAYDDAAVGGVTGRTVERALLSNSDRTTMRVSPGGRTIINLSGFDRCTVAGLKGANMSFRAATFAKLGGFDRNFTGSAILEDVDYSFRVTDGGWTLLFEPKAELLHLSAPAGGVRITDQMAREAWRFELTAYFLLKHRGPWSMLPFGLTFGLIAAMRALRWRRPSAIVDLAAAARRGGDKWRRGSDQALFNRKIDDLADAGASAFVVPGPVGSV